MEGDLQEVFGVNSFFHAKSAWERGCVVRGHSAGRCPDLLWCLCRVTLAPLAHGDTLAPPGHR